MSFFGFWTVPVAQPVQTLRRRQGKLTLAKPRLVTADTLTEVRETLAVPVKVRETAPVPAPAPQAKPATPKKTRAAIKAEKREKASARREESYHPGKRGCILDRRGIKIAALPTAKLAAALNAG